MVDPRVGRALWRGVGYLAMLAAVAVIGVPTYWMLSASVKTIGEIYTIPPVWIPTEFRWSNFPTAWETAPFERFYLNSIITSFVGMGLEVLFAVTTAYGLVFLRFSFKRAIFVIIIAALMIPPQVTILPNFITMANVGWVNTHQGIILPGASAAFGTFLMRQHFMTLPRDILDAARVDGASHRLLLTRIVVPLSRPVLITVALLSLIAKWNEFLWPLIITNTVEMRTLPIGISYLLDIEGNTDWGVLMAGTIFVIAPMLVIFLLAQRYIVGGITAGATKG